MTTRSLIVVAHGSRHRSWNQSILDFAEHCRDATTATEAFSRTVAAFMELSDPSIPDTLRDEAQHSDELVVMPLFLSVSKHLREDVPAEVASAAQWVETREDMSLYDLNDTPVWLLPPPPAPVLLADNIAHRLSKASVHSETAAGVLVFYGTASYQRDWDAMAQQTCDGLAETAPAARWTWGYGGDSVGFAPEPLLKTVNTLLTEHERVFIVPCLVGYGVIQREVIPAAVQACSHPDRIQLLDDAILPDPALAATFVSIAQERAESVFTG